MSLYISKGFNVNSLNIRRQWTLWLMMVAATLSNNIRNQWKVILVPWSMFIGEKWPHKEDYRQWYTLSGVGSWGYKCQVSLDHFTISYCSNLLLYYLIYFLIISFLYSTTYITCPADPKKTLGIKLPFLIMIIKNLRKYFTFEVQVGHTYRDPYIYVNIFIYTRGIGFHV